MSLVPEHDGARQQLERDADAILRAAFEQLRKDGRIWDADGRRVASLDDEYFVYDEPAHDVDFSDNEDVLLREVAIVAGLTLSELELVDLIIRGGPMPGGYRWAIRAGDLLGKKANTVHQLWASTKRKLVKYWANEPRRGARTSLCHETVGLGLPLVTGGEKPPTRRIDPWEAAAAMVRHADEEWRNSDWQYQSSLTEDGWQLGDDALWS